MEVLICATTQINLKTLCGKRKRPVTMNQILNYSTYRNGVGVGVRMGTDGPKNVGFLLGVMKNF